MQSLDLPQNALHLQVRHPHGVIKAQNRHHLSTLSWIMYSWHPRHLVLRAANSISQVLGWRLEDKLGLFLFLFLGGGGELSQWQGALLLLKCLFLFYMASTVWILLPLSLDFPGNVFFFYSRHAADAHLIFQGCPSGLLMKSQSFCIPGPAFRIRL